LRLCIRRGLKKKGKFCLEHFHILLLLKNLLLLEWVKVKEHILNGFVL